MKTIYKYQLGTWDQVLSTGHGRLEMPGGAKVLTLNIQDHVLTLWCEVDTARESVARRWSVHGTGHAIPLRGEWVGTLFFDTFVWHVYLSPDLEMEDE